MSQDRLRDASARLGWKARLATTAALGSALAIPFVGLSWDVDDSITTCYCYDVTRWMSYNRTRSNSTVANLPAVSVPIVAVSYLCVNTRISRTMNRYLPAPSKPSKQAVQAHANPHRAREPQKDTCSTTSTVYLLPTLPNPKIL